MADNGKFRVNVVSSSGFLNETFKRFLNSSVFEVDCCSDGLNCIKAAAAQCPSLIFLDMSLTGFHSLDTLKVLHSLKISKLVPVIIMVLKTQTSIVAESIDQGISMVLYKPFDRNDILKIVDDLLGHKIRERTASMPPMEAAIIHAELKKKSLSVLEEKMTRIKLLKNFLQIAKIKKGELERALENRESMELYKLFTEIHPATLKIGYPRVTMLCEFIEKRLSCTDENLNWNEISRYVQEVISLLEQIQIDNS